MTLVSSIIQDAYRESNMLPLGKPPSDLQNTEALRLYNALLGAIYGGDAGEPLTDWPLGNFGRSASTDKLPYNLDQLNRPAFNLRLLAVNDAAMTVYLAPQPSDGARYGVADPFNRLSAFPLTLDGNGRTIEGAATLLVDADGTNREWLYRGDLGAWLRITGVELTTENPFPAEFDAMFVILLAMRLSPRYGRALDEASAAILKQGRQKFVARYLQSRPLVADDSISWPFMSLQSFGYGRDFSTQGAFDRGWVR